MIVFNNTSISGSYCEIPQSNQIRWANLYKEDDGTFTYESKLWKCKDFMNELVSKYQGNSTSIYGYDAGSMRVNEDGVYLEVRFLHNKEVFKENVGSISKLPGYVPLPCYDTDNGFLLFVPKFYFENTWRISLLTYMIRVANVESVIDNWEKHPTLDIDCPFKAYWPKVLSLGFNEPKKGFWYYMGEKYTFLKSPMTSIVHDCGVAAWMQACAKEGLV